MEQDKNTSPSVKPMPKIDPKTTAPPIKITDDSVAPSSDRHAGAPGQDPNDRLSPNAKRVTDSDKYSRDE